MLRYRKYFGESGIANEKFIYRYGVQKYFCDYYDNGKKDSEICINEFGKVIKKKYYKSGMLRYVVAYTNGREIGTRLVFSEEGYLEGLLALNEYGMEADMETKTDSYYKNGITMYHRVCTEKRYIFATERFTIGGVSWIYCCCTE